jgi:hypothetical protein
MPMLASIVATSRDGHLRFVVGMLPNPDAESPSIILVAAWKADLSAPNDLIGRSKPGSAVSLEDDMLVRVDSGLE